MKDIIAYLLKEKKTISTMESCTGGCVANAITNISHASEVFKFGAVTYSNEYKIKMGVNEDIIKKYSVYSMNVAKEMSKEITKYTNSNYGIGITGTLKRKDPFNASSNCDNVYISIYDKDQDLFVTEVYICQYENRVQNKEEIINIVIKLLKEIFN